MSINATVAALFLFSASLTACGDDEGGESFDNLPDCVLDHSSLGEPESIAHCLVDFPGLHPDFADQAACEAWVEGNGGYPNSREAACMDYFREQQG
jgi:hypothetical protein